MAGERQTGPDTEADMPRLELIARLGGARAGQAGMKARAAAAEARAETIRAETVAEIAAWLRQNGAPDLGGGYCDAADEIEREFGCDAENGETA